MKRGLSLFLWSIMLALVWAASHDIMSDEGDLRLEYAVIYIGFLLALAALAAKIRHLVK